MAVTLGSNIASIRAQRVLSQNSQGLETVFERLSSGQRINRASDDAAGLAIASSLRADARVYGQAVRNVNDGLSLINIAASTLAELSKVVTRQQELAVQASNGSLSREQRVSLHKEAAALTDEFNRIAQSTEFNGQKLFEGSGSELRIQAGVGELGSLGVELDALVTRTVGDGTFEAGIEQSISINTIFGALNYEFNDVNGDGLLDVIAYGDGVAHSLGVALANGDGTFASGQTLAISTPVEGASAGDFNGDGIVDILSFSSGDNTFNIYRGNGDGTFQAAMTVAAPGGASLLQFEVGDLNNDGRDDILSGDGGGDLTVVLGAADYIGIQTLSGSLQDQSTQLQLADVNGDGNLDLISSDTSVLNKLQLGDGTGSFGPSTTIVEGLVTTYGLASADFNNDGLADLALGAGFGEAKVLLSNGDGTFQVSFSFSDAGGGQIGVQAADLNGDGLIDLGVVGSANNSASAYLNLGDGTFSLSASFDTDNGSNFSNQFKLGDITGDGAADFVVGLNTGGSNPEVEFFAGNASSEVSQAYVSLSTRDGALAAISELDATAENLSAQLGVLGAFQSRLQVAGKNLLVAKENFIAAESRIRDADIASESSELIRRSILQQAAAAVLAQANIQPQLALDLLS